MSPGLQLGNGQGEQLCVPLWDSRDLAGPTHIRKGSALAALRSGPDLSPLGEVSFFLDIPGVLSCLSPSKLCYLCRPEAYRGDLS